MKFRPVFVFFAVIMEVYPVDFRHIFVFVLLLNKNKNYLVLIKVDMFKIEERLIRYTAVLNCVLILKICLR